MIRNPVEDKLISKRKEIMEWLSQYTIPLYFFDKLQGLPPPAEMINGSGVLVCLDNEYYILTAGHCINEWLKANIDYVITALEPDISCLKIVAHGCLYHEDVTDLGFFKLTLQCVSVLETMFKKFLPLSYICADPPDKEHRLVISGFPKKVPATEYPDHTVIQGQSCGTDPVNQDVLRVWTDKEELESTLGTAEAHLEIQSGGISGGGCWAVGDILSEQWKLEDLRLVGIHFRARRDISGTGHYKKEMVVLKHLRFIAVVAPRRI